MDGSGDQISKRRVRELNCHIDVSAFCFRLFASSHKERSFVHRLIFLHNVKPSRATFSIHHDQVVIMESYEEYSKDILREKVPLWLHISLEDLLYRGVDHENPACLYLGTKFTFMSFTIILNFTNQSEMF